MGLVALAASLLNPTGWRALAQPFEFALFWREEPLYRQLEKLVRERRYTNRSEFVRDMIREQMVGREWKHNAEALGTVTTAEGRVVRIRKAVEPPPGAREDRPGNS